MKILLIADWLRRYTCTPFERLRRRKTKLHSLVSVDSLILDIYTQFRTDQFDVPSVCMIGHLAKDEKFPTLQAYTDAAQEHDRHKEV